MKKGIKISPRNCMTCSYGIRTPEDAVKCTHPCPKTKQNSKGWYCYSHEEGSML